jgi:hypothetical protein
MAARKKKAKKASKAAKAKRAPARKAKKTAKKTAKRPAKKAKKTAKKSAKKSIRAAARKAPARKAKKVSKPRKTIGEGDYAASRAFLKDQAGFVEKNKAGIPAMGKEAEKALDGPEGAGLRDAEATAAARSRDIF